MQNKIILLAFLLTMSACSYFQDDSVQDVKFETPGAYDAVCYVYIEKLRYVVRPPQVINLFKSDEDMKVDCLAPGNRRQTIYIDPYIEESVYQNALNAGVGAAWDHLSKAMYRWPNTISINFVDMPVREEALPTHNNPDIRQPETYKLEEFLPGRMRLNSDINEEGAMPMIRRGEAWYDEDSAGDETGAFSEPSQMSPGKGDLQQVIESLNDSNTSGDAEQSPVSINPYPGQ